MSTQSSLLAQLSIEAGFPPGVLNVLSGHGTPSGACLASHMDVRAISFTGSARTGRLIQIASAKSNLKSVILELGGKIFTFARHYLHLLGPCTDFRRQEPCRGLRRRKP